jgi:hypothetical protein
MINIDAMSRTATPTDPFISAGEPDETATTSEIRWPAAWLKQKERAMQGLRNLPANWDSYGAAPVDRFAIERAVLALRQIARITVEEPSVSASPSGTPLLVWVSDTKNVEVELEFLSNGKIVFSLTDLLDSGRDNEGVVRSLRELVDLIPGA